MAVDDITFTVQEGQKSKSSARRAFGKTTTVECYLLIFGVLTIAIGTTWGLWPVVLPRLWRRLTSVDKFDGAKGDDDPVLDRCWRATMGWWSTRE